MDNTIYSIDAQVLAHQSFAARQFILTLSAAEIVAQAQPGQFVHIQCTLELLMRRPFSIMSIDKNKGTIDLLYKVVGMGTELLSQAQIGDTLATMGPIGNGFTLQPQKRQMLLLGGGVGMPPIIAMAQKIKDDPHYKPMVILASEVPYPFDLVQNNYHHIHQSTTKTIPLLKGWGINCALASLQAYQGVYQGYISDLAKIYLDNLPKDELTQLEIFACGPVAMLAAVAQLSAKYNLSAQLSLEEYMACGVGGCAGCTVKVRENGKESMQRVCVDGPVFAANTVFAND